MGFIQVKISVSVDLAELLIAELVEAGYDSFEEHETSLDAYVEETIFSEKVLKELVEKYSSIETIAYSFAPLEEKNWNEEWEKNFQPVEIGSDCIIRASFHKPTKNYRYDIVINPKMSFGTGHHETTAMMVAHQLEINHKDKHIIDAGSGTGILAIMAAKLGAATVEAFDIEDWAFDNLKENCILNGCLQVSASQGSIRTVAFQHKEYDILLANINRNVLIDEMNNYAALLRTAGKLVLSGFYTEDCMLIEQAAEATGLKKISEKEKNNWASLVFIKQ